MSRQDGRPYKPNDYLIHCESCGRKIYRSEAFKDWQNYLVCKRDWDPMPDYMKPTPIVKDPKPAPEVIKLISPTNNVAEPATTTQDGVVVVTHSD